MMREPYMANELLTPFEHQGTWWMPNLPDDTVPGTLSYDPAEGCRLSLIGEFEGTGLNSTANDEEPNVIHGVINGVGLVTLYDNLQISSLISIPGHPTQSYYSRYALVGANIEAPESFMTSQCEFRLTHLEEWLGHNPFKIQFPNNGQTRIELRARSPDQEQLPLHSSDMTLKTSTSYHRQGDEIREVNLEALAWLVLEPSRPKHFTAYWNLVSQIRDLVALSLGERVYISDVAFRGMEEEIAPGKTRRGRIICYYEQSPTPVQVGGGPHRISIRLDDFADKKEELVNRWMVLNEDIRPSLDLLFAVLYNDMYTEVKFILVSQAIEALHRLLWPSTYVGEEQYEAVWQKLVDSIPQTTPQHLKDRLTQTLRYGNEYSLRRRLRDLSQRISDAGDEEIVGMNISFINDVVNTRNYLTHYDDSLKSAAKEGTDLVRIHNKLALAVMYFALTELGVPKEKITAQLRRPRLFGQPLYF